MQKDIVIRNANHSDYKSLCEIFAQANAEHCEMRPDLYRSPAIQIPRLKYHLAIFARNLFGYQPASLHVAEHHGKNVGVVFVQSMARSALSWSKFEKEAYLDNIVVVTDFRRQGIGSALLEAAQKWARNSGHAHMWGKILHHNDASFALFKKSGFSVDSSNVGCHLN